MRAIIVATGLFFMGLAQISWAQSTTGGRSGGSTASTGTGYLTPGKRPAETSATSMTIADEGASRAYMYVPPTNSPNRATSPDGSDSIPTNQSGLKSKTGSGKKPARRPGTQKP